MKYTLQIFTVILAGLFFSAPLAKAQNQECGTDEYTRELELQHPEMAKYRQQMQEQVRQYLQNNPSGGSQEKGTVKLIPVVVHLITETGGGGLTKAEIEQGIAHMNDDYRGLSPDSNQVRQLFKNLITDSEIEFRLAKIDPDGNCTEGIVRIASPLTNGASPSNAVKSLSYWPADRYFNIWLVNSIVNSSGGGLNGYAQFPTSGSLTTYGIVCRIDRFGLDYTNGIRTRTLSHEVGHCLGLPHTFQSGCGNDCSDSGDEICDTPPSSYDQYSCSTTLNTCTNDMVGPSPFTTNVPDQFENYMAYGNCRMMFTHGQRDRMQAVLNVFPFLQNLTSPANAIATGIAGPATQVCAPVAQFAASEARTCVGDPITFTDLSFNATPDASWTWNWSFPGGSPATSTLQNPTVTYAAPGIYSATLTVTNSAGNSAITKTDYVTVWSASGETGAYTQGFEEAAFPAHPTDVNKDWILESGSTNSWQRFTDAAATGQASLRIRNQVIGMGTINSIITPALDLSGISNPVFTFDLAYATGNSGDNDRLKVYYSFDCGKTWSLRYSKAGAALSTVGSQPQPNFEPTQASHWRTEPVLLSSAFARDNVRFKFEATSGQGNAIYIDNINIGGVSATGELTSGTVNLYPNPATNHVLINLNLQKESAVSCLITDVTGRAVRQVTLPATNAGNHEIPVSLSGLPAGVYVVQVSDGASVITRKLVKQ